MKCPAFFACSIILCINNNNNNLLLNLETNGCSMQTLSCLATSGNCSKSHTLYGRLSLAYASQLSQ